MSKIDNDVCPFVRNEENNKVRYNPQNAKQAYCFQLYDTLRILYGLSVLGGDEAWNKQLDVLESQIGAAYKLE